MEIAVSASTLVHQAKMTAAEYLDAGITEIDRALGKGYAKAHPELLAAFMQVAAKDYETGWATQGLRDAAYRLADAIDALTTSQS